ncbi:DNA mismatch repair protein (Pms1) [Aspergillus bombycis]|uniref:DNA mismatch repair protein PMS1 n=1 Tax=Aspergillus bombycis TaxID=109264 RepID=A0A1F7ZNQ1_9EURO|nr:DNA mismatch repair protein (Pms1) [Aspergillus bombycis]OGM40675.1 DNA mismatch repair protein (Pms1) [Aspergillus bombycis]
MATIKAIEARSVHQIQSGQVIVDLCSVAKELVENSLDAGATSIEVRFKNNGLDLIEVQDNGSGISPENYENVALKHYTSKLSSYEDLSRLQTFGFRGEALSSLCALSEFHVVTAQANQAPKANRLDFEPSGKLKKTQIVAGQKGTTVSVEGLFKRLPVRRRELEKNIKREYGKVLNLLHAYACVSTGVRFSVKNTVAKTRNVVVFSTNGNQTTKENIANVYGAKTLLALIPLDLTLEFEPSVAGKRAAVDGERELNKIFVRGHVSRPVFGEGRQTPDRQMFFVNSRPCGLPQIAKAFNEVYKSFNVSQSPFVFADFHMDTNAYDVNVSPDKRTILLHDAGVLIESLKTSLTQLFESSDQTVPQSQVNNAKQSTTKLQPGKLQDILTRKYSSGGAEAAEDESSELDESQANGRSRLNSQHKMRSFLSDLGSSPGGRANISSSPLRIDKEPVRDTTSLPPNTPAQQKSDSLGEDNQLFVTDDDVQHEEPSSGADGSMRPERAADGGSQITDDDDAPQSSAPPDSQQTIMQGREPSEEIPNTIQNAFDRMRPRRTPAELATITIGNKTVTSIVGSGPYRKRDIGHVDTTNSPARKRRIHTPSRPSIFGKHMRGFAAPGAQVEHSASSEAEEEEEDYDEEEEAEDVADEEEEIEDDEPEDESRSPVPSDQDSVHSQDEALPEAEVEDEPAMSQQDAPPVVKPLSDEEKKKHEEAEVQRLIQQAEEQAALPQESNINRANKLNKGATHRDSTVNLVSTIDGSLSRIQLQADKLQENLRFHDTDAAHSRDDEAENSQETAEERLSLTVSKDDFGKMRIAGQFNLGFILATRPSTGISDSASPSSKDELFIIDQHASDEKFNFERLQAETVVQNQRLVQPKQLDLTAVEEEIVIENQSALEKNGFVVEIDDSGNEPIGRRCKLVSLPLSKEVVFGVRDLEELIVLLSETPASSAAGPMYVPRPSKVRKMFAMRACRSSIMIGKNLSQKQMTRVVRNMGTIDKPWNCPHGRPTMRHLMSLGQWNEYDEFDGDEESELEDRRSWTDPLAIWKDYSNEMTGEGEEREGGDEDEDEAD